jgi:hypothetical protein
VRRTAAFGASRSCGPSLRRSPSRTDSNRAPVAPTQLDDLKIGSDTGTCFKVGV